MTINLLEYWLLNFVTASGMSCKVWGSRDVLDHALREWETARITVDGTGTKILTVEGFTGTADRAEVRMDIVVDEFVAAFLVRMT